MTQKPSVGQLLLIKLGRIYEDKADTEEERCYLRQVSDAYLEVMIRRKETDHEDDPPP